MKSLKITLVAFFATTYISIFCMDFLDPVLKNDKEIINIENITNISERKETVHEETPNIEGKACFFCHKEFGKNVYARDYVKLVGCTLINSKDQQIVHTECLKKDIEARSIQKNAWRFCSVCDIDCTHKDNKHHLETLPSCIQTMIQEKMKEEQVLFDEQLLKKDLLLQSCITTLLTFGMIYSHKNFHWAIDFGNSFIFGLLDSYYGLSSAQLHTSSDIRIKLLGKCLYILANKIIPAYTLYKSLNKKIVSDALFSSLQLNKPNKITNIGSLDKNKKKSTEHYYHEKPLLVHLIQEVRSKKNV